MRLRFSSVLLFVTGIFLSLTLSQCTPKSDLSLQMDKTQSLNVATTQTQLAQVQTVSTTYVAPSMPIGINISGLYDWATQWVFIDLMKTAREWITFNESPLALGAPPNTVRDPWDSKLRGVMPVDANGYPLSIPFAVSDAQVKAAENTLNPQTQQSQPTARFVVAPNQRVRTLVGNASYPDGRYHVMYEGAGDLSFTAGGQSKFQKVKEGLYYLDLSPEHQAITLTINRSQLGNPIRNIRVVHETLLDEFNKGTVFNPLFIQRLKDLKVSVLRFMEFQKINNSPVVNVEQDYPSPTYYTQASYKGAAITYATQLANLLNVDIWISIHDKANDEYITKLATDINQTLDKTHKVYVEYSNELWNYGFQQATNINKLGCANPTTAVMQTSNPTACDEHRSGDRFHVKRFVDIINIFITRIEPVRLVKVVGGQASAPWPNNNLLSLFKDTQLNPTKIKPDVLAIAPYFGFWTTSKLQTGDIDSLSSEQILAEVEQEMNTDPQLLQKLMATKNFQECYQIVSQLRNNNSTPIVPGLVIYNIIANMKASADHGAKLITYEAGQHLVATGPSMNNETLTSKLINANRAPQMGKLYQQYLNYWFSLNPQGLLVHFANVYPPSRFGSWGLLEYQDQDPQTSPKFMELKAYAQCIEQQKIGQCS